MHHRDQEWRTCGVPTFRPRHQVTETPEVARTLDLAAERWPNEPRSRLLLLLVDAGRGVLEPEQQVDDEAHRTAVTISSGRYAEAFGADYLHELREDWPA